MNVLYDECIEALGDNIDVLSKAKSTEIVRKLMYSFPFNKWVFVEWNNFLNKKNINNFEDIHDFLKDNGLSNSTDVYVIWNNMLPVIKTSLMNVLNNFDDVECVAFDTWLLSVDEMYLIEFHHDGDRGWTIGLTSSIRK